MKRYIAMFLTGLGALLVSVPVFAQQPAAGGGGATDSTKWAIIAAAFGMAIASAVCGFAQSKAAASACEGLARNPGARPGIQLALILALVLIESMALYTFAIAASLIFGISRLKIG